jgi:hypothetical protein
MSDIVKRLRGLAKAEMFLGAYTEAKSITDAADEIERLRTELKEMQTRAENAEATSEYYISRCIHIEEIKTAAIRLRQAFVIAVGDKSPFAKNALTDIDKALERYL